MKNRQSFFYFLFYLLLVSVSINAQTRRDIRTFSNFNRFIKKAIPAIENSQARTEAKKDINFKKKNIINLLKWNQNSGVLYRIRAQKDMLSQKTIFLPIERIGIGESPLESLVDFYSTPSISAAPSKSISLKMDSSRSFYIWVTNKRNFFNRKGIKLEYGLISDIFYKSLNNDALKIVTNSDLKIEIINSSKIKILEGVLYSLKLELDDEKTYNRIYKIKNLLVKQTEEINSLEAILENNLDDIRRANESLKFLQTFDKILSITNLALQVSSINNIPISETKTAKIPEDLKILIDNKIQKLDKNTKYFKTKINVERIKIIKNKNILKNTFKNHSVSPELIIKALM